jgi:glycerol kinase
MTYGTAEMLSVMAKNGKVTFQSLRVDGGASANNWLLQYQADVLGIPVERPDIIETTAMGAAGLAGIAGGVWKDADEFIGTRQFARFEPSPSRELAEEGIKGWQRAVRTTLGWAQDRGEKKRSRRSSAGKRSGARKPAASKKPAKKTTRKKSR